MTRIKELWLRNFRGFGEGSGPENYAVLDTDGQMVLLEGANGLGKTSTLEAVVLLLTGQRMQENATGENDGGEPASPRLTWSELSHRSPDPGAPASPPPFSLRMTDREGWSHTCELSAQGDALLRESRSQDGTIASRGYWDLIESRLSTGKDAVQSELMALASSFFQEDLRRALDDLAGPETLIEWFRPRLPELDDLVRIALEASRSAEVDADAIRSGLVRDEEPGADWKESADKFAAAWREWEKSLNPDSPRVAPGKLWDPQELELFVRGVAQARGVPVPGSESDLPRPPREQLETLESAVLLGNLNSKEREELTRLRAAVEELTRAQARFQDAINRSSPMLRWAAASRPGLPSLDLVLQALRQNLGRWRQPPPDDQSLRNSLQLVLDQLAWIDEGTLGALESQLYGLVREGREAQASLKATIAARALKAGRIQELEGRGLMQFGGILEQWKAESWAEERRRRRLSQRAERKAAAQQLSDLASALAALGNIVGDARAQRRFDESLQKTISHTLDNTLFRFALDPDALPVRARPISPKRGGETRRGLLLTTADGRPWSQLSTGQKGQLALAWMLARALVLEKLLPYRVLVLDDTSSSFDLGNLARQATWLRQLAYNPDPDRRWQVFLSSHHEEMTARLLRGLRPPKGCSMRFLTYRAWDAKRGPKVECRKVEPTNPPSVDHRSPPEDHVRVQTAMRLVWHRPLEP